jgi:monoterpene epsilon-lactone hydrolase
MTHHVARVIAEGDLAAAHNLVTTSQGHAGVDILRLENGTLVEHRDARPPVPETAASHAQRFACWPALLVLLLLLAGPLARNVPAAGVQESRTTMSTQIEAVSDLYESWGARLAASPSVSLDKWRDMIEGWEVLTAEPGGVDYIESDAGGIPALWAIPKGAAEDRVILSIHGGGFVTGSMYTHRKLFAHLAKSMGARALILNFGRSPEHVHPGPVNDVVAAYRWLLHQGIKPRHIAFSGDSAGGGLSVTAQICARDQGLPLPGAALLMSPWVDMTVEGDSWTANSGKDVLFTRRESVQRLASMFLGPSGDPRDPLANPLHADLKGLAPVYIQVGGDEALLDDSRRLAERARKAGVDVRLDVLPKMQHTFQMCVGRAPEADDAIRRFAEWARPRLGLGRAGGSGAR